MNRMENREERLEAVQDYLINNIGELAEILEGLNTDCSELFGFTVHGNTEEFFNKEFRDDPYSAVLLTQSDAYDVEDEFLICYKYSRDLETFSRSYPHLELDMNLSDIAELIVRARNHEFAESIYPVVVAAMSDELYDLIKGL
ncbi:hypothetical protein Bp8pC_178 [Bacillus phage Bp8p-C]|uniref:Uncharacterized protein n=2 Tax=Agatevirus Bp8pC TaxID=1910937 RepID=A0A0A0PJD8_9CAUD|nr:hypothetical protein AXJ20_gp170 [Bacillus phage Bp8p-C]YP_009784478.1 hypothetical protein QLX39_gp170 [Bacillus phage Bp8p-T]AHJ87608.1 hypothetical protein Bp8pC_178 [Bacillus phage Bp8p-C]AHJ87819.1 hypothetical protein Bp8pT_178 [Bacillus phage Bp8p-T]